MLTFDIAEASATVATKLNSPSPVMITATIDGQVVSWANPWFGFAPTSSPAAPAAPAVPVPAKNEASPEASPDPQPEVSQPEISEPEFSQPQPELHDAPAFKTPPASNQKFAADVGLGPKDSFTRIGYYNAENQVSDGLVFLGNHGGQGSGSFS